MGEAKRTFKEIRGLILTYLNGSKKTINSLSKETNINWKTVKLQLIWLLGRGLVVEVFRSNFVRIFQITEEGREFLEKSYSKDMGKLEYIKVIDTDIEITYERGVRLR